MSRCSRCASTVSDPGAAGGGADDAAADRVEELLGHAVAALGGARREGQVRMARAVHDAFARGGHLAVQAGTGTGKSLAYLVPAVAAAIDEGSPTVVSTATIALQRQLVERDLPRLAEALGPHLPRRPSFAILKGRNNYLCRKKLADVADGPGEVDGQGDLIDPATLSRTAREVLRLREWAEETEDGDRDSLERGVRDLAWRQVSVGARECVGAARCPVGADCFAERARRAADDVDVVVTNHALLAIDALAEAAVLPEHRRVVVDEAHELVNRITSAAAAELGPAALALTATRARKAGAEEQAADLVDAADLLAEALGASGTAGAGRWRALPEGVGEALTALRQALWATQTALAGSREGDLAERQTVRATCENLHDTCVRALTELGGAAPVGEDVVWLDERRTLHVAPLDVSGLLRDRLFAENTVVLTSATLALGGDFRAMAAAWGLPKSGWRGIDVGSPFDPARAGILYVARHLPKPGRDGTAPAVLDELEGLIRAAGGRTLGLFSSRRGAEAAAAEMRRRLPFDILCQGDDATGALVARFAAEENTCLFGTLSLWQGVDVPGPALSLVVIDRIPFPRPDEPLSSARAEAADAAGRNGFMEVSAAHAALLLAQGAGRLLRDVADRGMVAVLDPRLATARYGPWLAASLPPLWRTTDPAVARAALERLVAARHRR